AVGVISTSRGGPVFTATWDYIYLTSDAVAPTASYRVNAGGPQVTTSAGTFVADNYFSPSPGNRLSVTNAIAGTTNDALYQTERWGNSFSYAFPVPNGQYKVVLHFAEIYWTTAGNRVFDVSIEGTRRLDNFDIVARAGAFTAIADTFAVTVSDGTLNIAFSSLTATGGKDNAKVSAIEVLGASAPPANTPPVANAGSAQTITLPTSSVTLNGSGSDADGTIAGYAWSQVSGPNTASFSSNSAPAPTVSGLAQGSYVFSLVVTDNGGATSAPKQVTITVNPVPTAPPPFTLRINAGGPQVTNSIGTFVADNYFSPTPGGTYSNSNAAIAGTTDDPMYRTERWGYNFAYAVPVPNGQYRVVLHFAEIYWTTAGNRLFDVSIEGVRRLDNYDIVAKAGAFTATTETFIVNVSDGTLNISFTAATSQGGKDNAKVSAIEILTNTGTQPVTRTLPAALTFAGLPATKVPGASTQVGSQPSRTTGRLVGGKDTGAKGPKGASAWELDVYPNPAGRQLHLRFSEPVAGALSYTLYTLSGSPVVSAKKVLTYAATDIPVDLGTYGLANGVYFLRAETGGRRKVVRVVFLRQ
ncbi:MAG: T9SS type A sorting domain-containing protein, partial [Chitinophagaceae bacterium]